MIISHHYKYCFFAIPRTASKAFSQHLISHYLGEYIAPMHVSHAEFFKTYPQYSDYYTFTTIRNPLDSIVSSYFKKKMDHNGRFSRGTFKMGKPIGESAMNEYRFIVKNNASFSQYFKEFYKDEYLRKRHQETVKNANYVLRFESLNESFKILCKKINLKYLPIPNLNTTEGRSAQFEDYYSEDIKDQARRVMQNIMTEWNYSFPTNWSS